MVCWPVWQLTNGAHLSHTYSNVIVELNYYDTYKRFYNTWRDIYANWNSRCTHSSSNNPILLSVRLSVLGIMVTRSVYIYVQLMNTAIFHLFAYESLCHKSIEKPFRRPCLLDIAMEGLTCTSIPLGVRCVLIQCIRSWPESWSSSVCLDEMQITNRGWTIDLQASWVLVRDQTHTWTWPWLESV
jgi:hypothetical protein